MPHVSNRAERRAQRERIRRKRIRQRVWGYAPQEWTPRVLGMAVACPHPCSGLCCGNRRRYEGPTLQERRAS